MNEIVRRIKSARRYLKKLDIKIDNFNGNPKFIKMNELSLVKLHTSLRVLGQGIELGKIEGGEICTTFSEIPIRIDNSLKNSEVIIA